MQDTLSRSRVRAGWLARQSMSRRIILATLVVTVIIMGAMIGVLAYQGKRNAEDNVQREMRSALTATDESLQLVFRTASARGQELMPMLVRALGGEPVLDGENIPTGEAGNVPRLVAGGRVLNGDADTLERLREATGADPAVIVRAGGRWVRAATLLTDAQGRRRIGSTVDANDILARKLDQGAAHTGLVQRNGRWYSLSIMPLRDARGTVYGGLTLRVDVNDNISHLLDWVESARVAGHGRLALLQPSADGKGWTPVMAAGRKTAERPDAIGAVGPDDALATLFRNADGFDDDVRLGQEGTPSVVAWHTVKNWDWVMVGSGKRADFLAKAHRELAVQIGMMLAGTLLIAALIGGFSAWALRPVRDMLAGMQRLGQGDLTGRLPEVPEVSRNEVHILFRSLRHMQDNLARTVAVVRRGVDEINTGASEIAAGNTDLSSRTEEQAASLEQTAASMEQLAATVKRNAETAREASALSMTTSEEAQGGGRAVAAVAETMRGISESSRKISEIVSLIDGIAFQTNILALNAAVEAARAGEQGRGFAVVAGEVRTLAQRSAVAAREIKALIEDSAGRVGTGAQQVQNARATMEQVVASVGRLTALVNGISGASEEQSRGIEEVNRAVAQMDQVTQQNAALVEQAAAAAGSLEEQARQLAEAVAVFKLAPEPNRGSIGDAYATGDRQPMLAMA
jgi:methyl-accepting chemotaxis protein